MSLFRITAGLLGLAIFCAINMNLPMTPATTLLGMIVIGAPSMAMIVESASRLLRKKGGQTPTV